MYTPKTKDFCPAIVTCPKCNIVFKGDNCINKWNGLETLDNDIEKPSLSSLKSLRDLLYCVDGKTEQYNNSNYDHSARWDRHIVREFNSDFEQTPLEYIDNLIKSLPKLPTYIDLKQLNCIVVDAMKGSFRDGAKDYTGCLRERIEEINELFNSIEQNYTEYV